MEPVVNRTAPQPVDDDAVNAALAPLRFVTVLHYYATGAGQELHGWLRALPVAETTLVEHPFPFSSRTCTRVERVCHDSVAVFTLNQFRCPLFIRYALDLLRTVLVVRHAKVTYDVYVGNGAFDTLAGIFLRWMGRVRRVVLYTIDYAPAAGGRRLYARLYRMIDRFCCYRADVIWNLSSRMQAARIDDGLDASRSAPVLHVPHGTHARSLRSVRPAMPADVRVAFMGHVQEKSGVQLFIAVMPMLRAEFPGLQLDVFGDGPYVPALRALVADKKLCDAVTFHGFIDEHAELEHRLAQCALGLALYRPDVDDFSRYADPGKPKVYLACGLPVIIVDVPEVAREIAERGAGVCIDYDAAQLADALRRILLNRHEFHARAIAMAELYDWHDVFTRAWQGSLALWEDSDGH
jgi:glycosyltransferase involved in cell wall biosynthesis